MRKQLISLATFFAAMAIGQLIMIYALRALGVSTDWGAIDGAGISLFLTLASGLVFALAISYVVDQSQKGKSLKESTDPVLKAAITVVAIVCFFAVIALIGAITVNFLQSTPAWASVIIILLLIIIIRMKA
jgi:hypothetical protein